MNIFDLARIEPVNGSAPRTPADRTRRLYDRVSGIYPMSTLLFHSQAHKRALELSGIRDGMKLLEVATGSGEMFRRLVRANRGGITVGLDLSPNMAARTQRSAWRQFPGSRAWCQAVDARHLPFSDESFDGIFCCYLLELLGDDDIPRVLDEFRRVLRPGGRLTTIMIGETAEAFNRYYRLLGRFSPAFYGRQVERSVQRFLQKAGFTVRNEDTVWQTLYPSRIVCAERRTQRAAKTGKSAREATRKG